MNIGHTWNESDTHTDPETGRLVRHLSTQGRINQTPTYHTNSGFTADSRYLVFVSVRENATWVIRAETATGELKALWKAPGIGDRNYIHRGMGLQFDDVDGCGICGNRVCIAPKSGKAIFTCERRVLAVDLQTCEETILLNDCGSAWIFGAPCVSPDEQHVVITLSSSHPDLRAGKPITKNYRDFPDHTLRLIRLPLKKQGDPEILYEARPAQSAHCAFCPTDNRLLYFDLDLPPGYWGGGDGKTPRIWLLDLKTGATHPLKNTYPGPFQTHQAWLWDGSAMAYHGRATEGGTFIGIADKNGHTLWERVFPQATFYGHLTPDPKKPALILDGDFTRDALQWLYYDTDDTAPKLEPICKHNTEWGSVPGQYSHPHPLTDPSGKWISFTTAQNGRTDVCVVQI